MAKKNDSEEHFENNDKNITIRNDQEQQVQNSGARIKRLQNVELNQHVAENETNRKAIDNKFDQLAAIHISSNFSFQHKREKNNQNQLTSLHNHIACKTLGYNNPSV